MYSTWSRERERVDQTTGLNIHHVNLISTTWTFELNDLGLFPGYPGDSSKYSKNQKTPEYEDDIKAKIKNIWYCYLVYTSTQFLCLMLIGLFQDKFYI